MSVEPKNEVSKQAVFAFKDRYCDENTIIPGLLVSQFADDLIAPILDVGAGIGDIAYNALHGKETILLDPNPTEATDLPLREHHRSVVGDFFDYTPDKPLGTLLISHTLQFIDDDVQRLNARIARLAPERIVLVLNSNDDIMGELATWADEHFPEANPERRLRDFPKDYNLVKRAPFIAQVSCPDFVTLAQQVAYLTLVNLGEKEALLISFLRDRLTSPSFTFNQTIESYARA